MASPLDPSGPSMSRRTFLQKIGSSFNYYRIHLASFILVPLLASILMYGSNGKNQIAFVDCVFLCVSAICVCGLATVNLSTLTGFQQAILFVLMLIGNPCFVSIITLFVRRHFFHLKFKHVIRAHHQRHADASVEDGNARGGLTAKNIRRVEGDAYPVNHSGERGGVAVERASSEVPSSSEDGEGVQKPSLELQRFDVSRTKTIAFDPDQAVPHLARQHPSEPFARTGTIEFVGTDVRRRNLPPLNEDLEPTSSRLSNATLTRSATTTTVPPLRSAKREGFGGFPTPVHLLRSALAHVFPKVEEKIQQAMTLEPTLTVASARSGNGKTAGPVPVPYISFSAIVGRNSHFKDMTNEQLEELGGVEYRALALLTWIVPLYFIGLQLIGFIVIYPSMKAFNYSAVFDAQPRFVPLAWYSWFNSVSAFSNTGLSLSDLSMVPFQTAYPSIFVMGFLILAGNTAFPVFLRGVIWIVTRTSSASSRLHDTGRFLLDHPRRCFLYLFPAQQTLFLAAVVFSLTMIDFVMFLVLDIGTPIIEALPVGVRIVDSLFQSVAVRSAGFAIVSIGSLAPAVQFLYVIMMYIAIYPLAMSIRASNVYEERSLGVYGDESEAQQEDNAASIKSAGWSKYLASHARRQLAFDLYWLSLALWILCIAERASILDSANAINPFSLIFEVVSAYGLVGLSFGLSYDNYSLCGSFSVLSKLVMCCVMIRGRHRGLPVAIDRAVMLPSEFEQEDCESLKRSRSRRSFAHPTDVVNAQ